MMTKEEIRYALKDAEAGGVKEQLIEALRLQGVLEEK